jgi:hypothetical protein
LGHVDPPGRFSTMRDLRRAGCQRERSTKNHLKKADCQRSANRLRRCDALEEVKPSTWDPRGRRTKIFVLEVRIWGSGVRTEPSADRTEVGLLRKFWSPYQSAKVRRSGEIHAPESDFRPFPRLARQQLCPENPRKPAPQHGVRKGRECYLYGNLRRECDWVQTVSGLEAS